MQITHSQPQVKATGLPLEKLAGSTDVSPSDKVAECSRQFEAILVRQIMSSAQKPAFPSKINPPSMAKGIQQDMLSSELADRITRVGGLGFAKQLQHDLTLQIHDQTTQPPRPDQTGDQRLAAHQL